MLGRRRLGRVDDSDASRFDAALVDVRVEPAMRARSATRRPNAAVAGVLAARAGIRDVSPSAVRAERCVFIRETRSGFRGGVLVLAQPRYRSEATGTVPARGVRRHARAHTTRDDADDRAPRARRPRRDRRVRLEGSSRPTRERDEKLDRCSCSSPPFARAPFVRRHRRPASRARIAPRLPRGSQRRRRGRAPRGRSLRGPTRRHGGQPHGRR